MFQYLKIPILLMFAPANSLAAIEEEIVQMKPKEGRLNYYYKQFSTILAYLLPFLQIFNPTKST